MGWRVNPACGLASAAGAPLSRFATVLLPVPAPPTTAMCSGAGGCSLRYGPTTFRTSAAASRSSLAWMAWSGPDGVAQAAPPAVLFQPAEVFRELARQGAMAEVFHGRWSVRVAGRLSPAPF